ncbi:PREDICTED: HBS1-like protein isoform X2 [Nicrophorus vespilloides]|uniref:HBS1-like protein isoform X2 n=1 Tax=Nicrophorus vespilloides TaxID=110193 RepID=A0ABM1NDJ1_NICVS|nr:PREDICTED: HBS1-like protein isoform X2 [Nicrophorus vespilloides]
MSTHNIRSMDFEEECDAFDDVYGHSVEDDYSMSPSQAAFMYNRNNIQIGSYLNSQKDIEEEDEEIESNEELKKAKLESCVEQIRGTLGTTMTRQQIVDAVVGFDYNVERALNSLLNENPKTQESNRSSKVQTEDLPSSKVVGGSSGAQGKTRTVTKGFDVVVQKDVSRLSSTPDSQSPASGRGTPVNVDEELNKKWEPKIDVLAQYKKDRSDSKQHLYMIVIGHVDAGKSTLMGHLLCSLGQVHQKVMHKYEQESRKLGKQSFMYAWVLDETGEERNRGITMDVGRSQFETQNKLVTLLDAPGHKDFIPNMISGAGQADVALLVVDATRGEFETGFDFGGQTREHALLVRSLGVSQLAVAINKLDTVSWSKERFDDIKDKLKVFLKQAGFREADVTFVPCSGLSGQNLVKKSTENELISWYNGSTLLEVIDNFRPPERPISKPLRFSINDIFKGVGSRLCVSGRVETGCLSAGDRVLLCPSREIATVKSITLEDVPYPVVYAGDQPTVTLSGVEMENVSVGYIMCDIQSPVQVASKFQCRIVVFNVKVPITKGYPIVLHHQSLMEPASFSKLISQLNKSTGEVVKKRPRFLSNNTSAMVEIQVSRPIALEMYSEYKELGRVTLRVGGLTIAAGLITKIIL